MWTPAKLRPSSRCSRASSSYTPTGVEPVASPSTHGSPAAARSRTSVAMRAATARDASAAVP